MEKVKLGKWSDPLEEYQKVKHSTDVGSARLSKKNK